MKLLLAVFLMVGAVTAQQDGGGTGEPKLTQTEQDALAIQPNHLPVEDTNAVEGTLGGLSAAMAAYIAFLHRKLKKANEGASAPKPA